MHNLLKVLLLGLVVSCSNSEEKPIAKESEKTTEVISTENSSKTVSNTDSPDGKILFATCITCHGASGQGNQELKAPALANQEAWYLKRQLANFRNGIRGNDPDDLNSSQMAAFAKALPNEAAINAVVSYIKTLPNVSVSKTITGDIANGKQYYDMICGACHGPGAEGNELLNAPRLTGINDWYLAAQYNKFSSGKRGLHPDDTYGKQMELMSKSLPTEEAVNNVVAYIHSLEE